MIRKLIDRLLGKAPPTPPLPPGVTLGQRVEIGVDAHGIDPKLLAEPAVRVVRPSRRRASRPTSSAAPCATC